MVENDKKMDSNEPVSSSTNTVHTENTRPYDWMVDGETVLSEIPVKYVLYIISSETTIGAIGSSGRTVNVGKTDIRKIIATDRRIAFMDKNGELFSDKLRAGRHSPYTPRQFFFYGKNTFNEYLGYISDHNQKIISDLRSKDPKFEKNFNEKGTVGSKRKLEEEGYITAIYFANALNLVTEKAYKKGGILRRKKILEPINGQPPGWFLKKKKKGIQIKATELNIRNIETNKVYADRGKNIMAHITDKKRFQQQPTDFFIRINNDQVDNVLKLVDSILGKILEMNDYKDKNAAKDAVYENYIKSDESEEQ